MLQSKPCAHEVWRGFGWHAVWSAWVSDMQPAAVLDSICLIVRWHHQWLFVETTIPTSPLVLTATICPDRLLRMACLWQSVPCQYALLPHNNHLLIMQIHVQGQVNSCGKWWPCGLLKRSTSAWLMSPECKCYVIKPWRMQAVGGHTTKAYYLSPPSRHSILIIRNEQAQQISCL